MAEGPACSERLQLQSRGLDQASLSIQTPPGDQPAHGAITGQFQKHCCLAMAAIAMAVTADECDRRAALVVVHLRPSILAQLLAAVVRISARGNTLSVAVLHTLAKRHQQAPPNAAELCLTPKFASCGMLRFSEQGHSVIPITLFRGRARGKKAH
ncbi:unnamed protein product [Symbiodinium sp. CCMP2592]|nr:unnamed protein product [Symbiodinium sp. CCMP2592]